MAASEAILCRDVQYEKGGAAILSLPQLHVRTGEHLLVLGASGCGKTTLLHLLAGLLMPSAGDIHIAGQLMRSMGSGARDRFRGRHIGMVYQTLHLLPHLSVVRNLELAAFLAGLPQDTVRHEALLETLGLAEKRHALPSMLSVGQQQRVAIARALVNRPTLVLADEPTSALDDVHCASVIELLLAQAKASGATLVVATHDARITPYFTHVLPLGGRP